jgi:hypothetical protein
VSTSAVVLEADPSLAGEILARGSYVMPLAKVKQALAGHPEPLGDSSQDGDHVRKVIRAYLVTRQAIDLSRIETPNKRTFASVSGLVSDEMCGKDLLALATLAMNVVRILARHLQMLPQNWEVSLKEVAELLATRRSVK